MRIAVFTDADFDRASDVTTALDALLRYAPADVRPRVYTLSDLEVDEADYLALWSPAMPLAFGNSRAAHLPRLVELHRRLKADEIRRGPRHDRRARRLLCARARGSSGPAARRQPARRRRASWYGTVRKPRSRAIRWYRKWLFRTCERILVPSVEVARRLRDLDWASDRLMTWPAGVDDHAFSPARRSRRLRDEWHVSERRPAILCVGPAEPGSGIEMIEPLGSLLHRDGVAHRFVVAGEGPWLTALRERCPDTVFAGALSARDMATVMASADLLLAPGALAGNGQMLLQAQASGLPVLAASLATARDHIRPGVTGFLAHPEDVMGLRVHAAELLGDDTRRRRMATAARGFAQSRTWAASLGGVYALYRTLSHTGEARFVSDEPRRVGADAQAGCAAVTLAISVIVCAHNEEGMIAACLHSLLAQTRTPDEILVINNASTDETGAVARQIPHVRVVDEPRKGLVVARETRARGEARGDIAGLPRRGLPRAADVARARRASFRARRQTWSRSPGRTASTTGTGGAARSSGPTTSRSRRRRSCS